MMRNFHWKKRNVSYIITIFLALYLFFRRKTYEHEETLLLEKIKPVDVWEYVADFSNMKDLNPTIISFNIIDESGNYDHWKYSVEYSEHLSHWPYLENHAIGHYDIKGNHQNDVYFINSAHITCLFGNYFCLNSKSSFKISNSRNGSMCQELIEYQCPAILNQFCFKEVDFQRKAIMKNLKLHFYKK
ncbi:uncharacterized protein [Onthophagus taurus]|uniref:uncharacterized protein n=1 Tax=Onthophagus taurus TaxID=166361 RepID=UPI000C205EDF|nr:uncharacterized protein LOC111421099 [Onthophagus taurus]